MFRFHFVLLTAILLCTSSARADEQTDREAIVAATRELARSLDLFQQVLVMDPGPIFPGGISGQASDAIASLAEFRQQVKNKASRDDLYVAFDAVDRQVKGILDLLPAWEKLNGGVRLAARRLQSSDHDLLFVLTVGDDAPAKQADVIYRQTLGMLGFSDDLQSTVTWLYTNRDPLNDWNSNLSDFRQAVKDFQKLQQKKAGKDDLKQQLTQVEQAWAKIVRRYQDTGGGDKLLLQNGISRVDQVLARIATRFGIKNRRATLNDYLSNY